MNLLQSNKTYEELIQHMEKYGYSSYHIQHAEREIRWLFKNQNRYRFSSYEEACHIRFAGTFVPQEYISFQYLRLHPTIDCQYRECPL